MRKLISRALTGSRQDIEMDPKIKLKLHIGKEEFWPKKITETDEFAKEIYDICKDELIIGNCLELYDSLNGDNILNKELFSDNNDIEDNDNDNKIGDEEYIENEKIDDDDREEL